MAGFTFDDLVRSLGEAPQNGSAPSSNYRDYLQGELENARKKREAAKPSGMAGIFKLLAAAAPIAVGAAIGGGRGAALGGGVASQYLDKESAAESQRQSEAEKYLQARESGLENMLLKSGLDSENLAAELRAKGEDRRQSLLGNVLMESAKHSGSLEKQGLEHKFKAGETERKISAQRDINQAKLDARSAAQRAKQEGPTAGQTAADRAFAKTYEKWRAAGGYATVASDISKLKNEVLSKLDAKDNSGDQLLGIPSKIPGVGEIITPGRVAIRENLASVVQKTMRQILGPQFTAKEAYAMIDRAYNPQLSPSENHKRVSYLLDSILEQANATEATADFFEKHGTIAKNPPGGSNSRATVRMSEEEYESLSEEDKDNFIESGGELD